MRHPVSPMTTIRRTTRRGSGRATPPAVARRAVAGSGASQTVTGKADGLPVAAVDAVGRGATVAAAKRTAIGTAAPSTVSTGHVAAAVTTRATGPASPITTRGAVGGRRRGGEQGKSGEQAHRGPL